MDNTKLRLVQLIMPDDAMSGAHSPTNTSKVTLDKMISNTTLKYGLLGGLDPPNFGSKWNRRTVGRLLFYMLIDRLKRDNSINDLEMAILIGDELLGDPAFGTTEERADIMDSLGFIKNSLYNINGIPRYINHAIELCRQAIALTAATDAERPHRLENLGRSLSARYNTIGNIHDLNESIKVGKEALEGTPRGHPKRYMCINNLCARLIRRHERTSQVEDQNEAIHLAYEAIEITAPGSTLRGLMLNNLLPILVAKFEQTGFRKDLEEAIHMGRRALNLLAISDNNEARCLLLDQMQILLNRRYTWTKDPKDLKEIAQLCENALLLAPQSDPQRKVWIRDRARNLKEYFDCTGTLDDLDNAITASMTAASEYPNHPSYFSPFVKSLVSLLGTKFLRFPTPYAWIDFLEVVIAHTAAWPMVELSKKFTDEEYKTETVRRLQSQRDQFLAAISQSAIEPIAQIFLHALHEGLEKRIDTMGIVDAVADIVNGCIDVRFDLYNNEAKNEEIFKIANQCFEQLGSFGLTNMSTRWRTPWMVVKRPDDEDKLSEEIASCGSPELSSYSPEELQKLSRIYEKLFSRTNDMEHLGKAIYYAQLLVTGTSENDKDRAIRLTLLASLIRKRFLQTDMLQDLDQATQLAERAFASMSNDASEQQACTLFTLAMILKSQYQRRGDANDLEKCIEFAEKAISIDKADGYARLVNYGLVMRLSYQRTHAQSDLDKALEATRRALRSEHRGARDTSTLNNMGLILYDQYERTRNLEDLRVAIRCYNEALEAKLGSPRDSVLCNLGNALVATYKHTGAVEDLDEAIRHGVEAVKSLRIAGMGHSDLSEMLLTRYLRNHGLEDLDEAIRHAEYAVGSAVRDHPNQAAFLTQLGDALAAKLNLQPSEESLQRCIQAYSDAWNCQTGRPLQRVQAGWQASRYLLQGRRLLEAAYMLEDAVRLVPKLCPQWVDRRDYQHTLSLLDGLAADAALVAIQAGRDASLALQLLELGRGVMMGAVIDKRSEIHPSEDSDDSDYLEMLRKLNHLRMQADAADPAADQQHNSHGGHTTRKIIGQIEDILEDIRRLPGHEDFLLPPRPEDIMSMAIDSPIVVISTSSMVELGLAIIVRSTGISSLPLPKLNHSEVKSRTNDMVRNILKGSLKSFPARNETMRSLLLWLWETVVEPILDELGFLSGTVVGSSLPRIRWIGVGLLSYLPFHAAGTNLPGSKCNAMSRVISSYLPSLRAFAFARERKPSKYIKRKCEASLLVVLMPETPGAVSLSSVEEETQDIIRLAATASMQATPLKHPSATGVLEQLPIHNLVHFACHGVSDPADPSNSHLMLKDTNLTVRQILHNHAAEAEVAFLSACSTAQNHNVRLVDESIHITSSFQLVGFRHVVGTLWTTDDESCREIARGFYSRLLAGEDDWDGTWKVAEALHAAISSLYTREYSLPLLWAPFVAFGG